LKPVLLCRAGCLHALFFVKVQASIQSWLYYSQETKYSVFFTILHKESPIVPCPFLPHPFRPLLSFPHSNRSLSVSWREMPSRTPQQGVSQTAPFRLVLIRTPFLLIRFVVFCQYERIIPVLIICILTLPVALLIYMSLTALVFAAWNVGASRAAGAHGEISQIRDDR
jgi:hypothetical protein